MELASWAMELMKTRRNSFDGVGKVAWLLAAVLLTTPTWAWAQDDDGGTETGTMNYGGVVIPTGTNNPTGPVFLSPTEVLTLHTPGSIETVYGRESGRTETDEEGNPFQVYQSTRISGIVFSHPWERFEWFYQPEELYTGVTPDVVDTLPHIQPHQTWGSDQANRNRVTWIGFQPFDAYTRVFVQLAREPSYTIVDHEDEMAIEIVFEETSLSLTNFGRGLDTSYFDSAVEFIDAESLSNRRTRVVIWLEENIPYTVTNEGTYLFVDFSDRLSY